MRQLRCAGLLTLTALLVAGQALAKALPNHADALVSGLYEQDIARHPLGTPEGADLAAFAPFLSKALLHRFVLNDACAADWRCQNPDPNLKPIVGMIEEGLFSGSSEQAEPKTFHIERTEAGKHGAARVIVKLTWSDPYYKPMSWYVAAVVIPERGRLVVDDILFLKNKRGAVDYRLSGALSSGCRRGHWVGRPDNS